MLIYPLNQETGLVYVSQTGIFGVEDSVGVFTPLFRCYSGAPGAINDPEKEKVKAVGPIPRGRWQMDAPSSHHRLGPVCIGLEAAGWKPYGRSGFFIHGDNKSANGSASTGCIIADRKSRDVIAALYWAGFRTLDVI